MKHLFVIDPVEKLNLKLDTSMRIMQALGAIGHEVWITTIDGLGWGPQGGFSLCCQIHFEPKGELSFHLSDRVKTELRSFRAIHQRKDPPYDLSYIATTWLLDSVLGEVRIYNDPHSLRSLNEKISVLHFREACRDALVSSDAEEVGKFITSSCDGDAIVKPLTFHGGKGVERIELAQRSEEENKSRIKQLLDEESPRIIQPFDKAIYEGEVRAFTAFGEVVGCCLKRPAKGSYLANTGQGATLEAHKLTPLEEERVAAVATSLMQQGVYFIGFDIIGEYISEVNITSPRLLVGEGESAEAAYIKIAQLIDEDLR